MLGCSRTTKEQDEQTVREVARALLAAMEQQGHICLQAATIATIKTNQDHTMATLAKLCDKTDALTNEVSQNRGERRVVVAVIGFVAAIFGGIIAKVF